MNIVLIMSDQHSRHVLGCYGNEIIDTPNLDKLAARGVTFNNAYCPYPICVPSRMGFMTGKIPSNIRVYDNHCALASLQPTYAHALKRHGYDTYLCGRMHFIGPDQHHGFQERIFPDGVSCQSPPAGELTGTSGFSRASIEKSGPGQNHYLLYDKHVIERACSFIEERDKETNDKPFLLTVGIVGPHCPFVCPPELFDKYYQRIDVPCPDDEEVTGMSSYNRRFRERSRVDNATLEEIRRTRAAYFGMVEYDDMLIGQLMDQIAASSLSEDTMIIYTSDHGEMAGEHGMWWKMNMYEGSAGVPLIFSHPQTLPQGVTINSPANLIDIAPTLCALTGADPLPDADGVSLMPELSGSDQRYERAVFSEIIQHDWGQGPSGGPVRMLRRGDWKAVYYHDEEPELFNLHDDPGELHNRASDSGCQERLQTMLADILSDWDPVALEADRAHLARLRTYCYQAIPERELHDQFFTEMPTGYGQIFPYHTHSTISQSS